MKVKVPSVILALAASSLMQFGSCPVIGTYTDADLARDLTKSQNREVAKSAGIDTSSEAYKQGFAARDKFLGSRDLDALATAIKNMPDDPEIAAFVAVVAADSPAAEAAKENVLKKVALDRARRGESLDPAAVRKEYFQWTLDAMARVVTHSGDGPLPAPPEGHPDRDLYLRYCDIFKHYKTTYPSTNPDPTKEWLRNHEQSFGAHQCP